MKKILVLISISVSLLSCSKDNLNIKEQTDNGDEVTYVRAIAIIEQNPESKALLGQGNRAYWQKGDTIAWYKDGMTYPKIIEYAEEGATFLVPVGSERTTAMYPFSASVDYNNVWVKPIQKYDPDPVVNTPMYSVCEMDYNYSPAVYIYRFKNVCSVFRLTLKGTDIVRSINLIADQAITGVYEDQFGGVLKGEYKDLTEGLTLDCRDGGEGVQLNTDPGVTFNFIMTPGEYTNLKIKILNASGKTCSFKAETFTARQNTFERATLTANNFKSVGSANGEFTVEVDALGNPVRKVRFAKGNLWNDGAGNFLFETQQYETGIPKNYVGKEASQGGMHGFIESHAIVFFPHSDGNISVKEPDMENGGLENFVMFTNDPQNPGKANPDFTADGSTGLWRALTADEWFCLINQRRGHMIKRQYSYEATPHQEENVRYFIPTIHNIRGLLLFPDTLPSDFDMVFGDYWDIITDEQWDTLEQIGFVFLPCTATRSWDDYYKRASPVGPTLGGPFYKLNKGESMNYNYSQISAYSTVAGSIRLVRDVDL